MKLPCNYTMQVICTTVIALSLSLIACGGGGGDPLPVDDLPLSTAPDANKIVTDLNGGIYPINHALVSLKSGNTRADARSVAETVNGSLIGFIPNAEIYQILIPASTIEELNDAIARIENNDRVEFVSKNYFQVLHNPIRSDIVQLRNYDNKEHNPPKELTAAYDRILVEDAWALIEFAGIEPKLVTIGIIDNGVDLSHPEFPDKNHIKSDKSTAENHGTSIAGIIGANNTLADESAEWRPHEMNGIVSGIPNAKYLLVNFVTDAALADRIAAIEKAITNEGAEVINMSFGSTRCLEGLSVYSQDTCLPRHPILEEDSTGDTQLIFSPYINVRGHYIRVFKAHPEVLFVASAGNDRVKADNNLPGGGIDLPNLITVGATDIDDTRADFFGAGIGRWGGSNYGQGIDIAAPGRKVYAPIVSNKSAGEMPDEGDYASSLNDNSKWLELCDDGFFCGTSAATPIVTGVVAMVKAILKEDGVSPNDIPAHVKTILVETANPLVPNDSDSIVLESIGSGGEPITPSDVLLGSNACALTRKDVIGCRVNALRAVERALNITSPSHFDFAVDRISIDGNIQGTVNAPDYRDGIDDFVDDFNDDLLTSGPTESFLFKQGPTSTNESESYLHLQSNYGGFTDDGFLQTAAELRKITITDGAGDALVDVSFRADAPAVDEFYCVGIKSKKNPVCDSARICVAGTNDGTVVTAADEENRTSIIPIDPASATGNRIYLALQIYDEGNFVTPAYSTNGGANYIPLFPPPPSSTPDIFNKDDTYLIYLQGARRLDTSTSVKECPEESST